MCDQINGLHDKCLGTGVKPPLNIVLFLLNLFLPGIGTVINAFVQSEGPNGSSIMLGFTQILLTPVLCIGWVWSIWFGYLILTKG